MLTTSYEIKLSELKSMRYIYKNTKSKNQTKAQIKRNSKFVFKQYSFIYVFFIYKY